MCVLLWAQPGMRRALVDYEDAVLSLLPEHSGAVVLRAATVAAEGQPDEIQLLHFESRLDIQAYMEDGRRMEREIERAKAIARTEVVLLADTLPDAL